MLQETLLFRAWWSGNSLNSKMHVRQLPKKVQKFVLCLMPDYAAR